MSLMVSLPSSTNSATSCHDGALIISRCLRRGLRALHMPKIKSPSSTFVGCACSQKLISSSRFIMLLYEPRANAYATRGLIVVHIQQQFPLLTSWRSSVSVLSIWLCIELWSDISRADRSSAVWLGMRVDAEFCSIMGQ